MIKQIKNHKTEIVDLIHDRFPHVEYHYISDVMVAIQILLVGFHITYSELMFLLCLCTIITIIRAFSVVLTVLPPLKSYEDKYRLGGINGFGKEYIFSGHASISAILAMFLIKNNIFSNWLVIIYNIIGQYLIVASKNHYSVDVYLAWVLVFFMYNYMELKYK